MQQSQAYPVHDLFPTMTRVAHAVMAAEELRHAHTCPSSVARQHQRRQLLEAMGRGLGDSAYEVAREQAASVSSEGASASVSNHAGPHKPRPATGWPALTDAELLLAPLVAQGSTNKEVASHLGIAAATVKAHLRNIYAKLGVSNRTALAAEVHRQGKTV